jgi:hypothetical protein
MLRGGSSGTSATEIYLQRLRHPCGGAIPTEGPLGEIRAAIVLASSGPLLALLSPEILLGVCGARRVPRFDRAALWISGAAFERSPGRMIASNMFQSWNSGHPDKSLRNFFEALVIQYVG